MIGKVVLGAIVALLLGACGFFGDGAGGDSPDARDAQIHGCDGGLFCSPPRDCNPLSPPGQQGCATGQKCTWVAITDGPPDPIGVVDCVDDGTVPHGGACTRAPAGGDARTGFDDCGAGDICIHGTCQDLCGFDGSFSAGCADGEACGRYGGLFANGDEEPIAGACAPTCDPLTQELTGGGACPIGEGCYVESQPNTTIAICLPAGTGTHGAPITGDVFVNSCAPGHTYRRTAQGAPTYECTALCRPADVTSTTHMTEEGGVAPFTCESQGAAPPDSATAGESCQYYWPRERGGSTPFSNTLGTCFKHAIHQYDTDGDFTPDAPWPRCTTLTTGDVLPPFGTPAMPNNDALYFACIAYPSAFAKAVVAAAHRSVAPVAVTGAAGWR